QVNIFNSCCSVDSSINSLPGLKSSGDGNLQCPYQCSGFAAKPYFDSPSCLCACYTSRECFCPSGAKINTFHHYPVIIVDICQVHPSCAGHLCLNAFMITHGFSFNSFKWIQV